MNGNGKLEALKPAILFCCNKACVVFIYREYGDGQEKDPPTACHFSQNSNRVRSLGKKVGKLGLLTLLDHSHSPHPPPPTPYPKGLERLAWRLAEAV